MRTLHGRTHEVEYGLADPFLHGSGMLLAAVTERRPRMLPPMIRSSEGSRGVGAPGAGLETGFCRRVTIRGSAFFAEIAGYDTGGPNGPSAKAARRNPGCWKFACPLNTISLLC